MADFFGGVGGLGESFASAGSSFLGSIAGSLGSALGGKLNGALGLSGGRGSPPVAGVPYNPPPVPTPNYVAAPAPVGQATPVWVYIASGLGGVALIALIVFIAKR